MAGCNGSLDPGGGDIGRADDVRPYRHHARAARGQTRTAGGATPQAREEISARQMNLWAAGLTYRHPGLHAPRTPKLSTRLQTGSECVRQQSLGGSPCVFDFGR
jgi:hypothetical protein